MKQLITTVLMLLALSTSVVFAQQAREYASNEVSTLLTDLIEAVDGDEFILTTPGDQGFYRIDTTALEIHADVTIRSADGLMVKPMVKLVYDAALSMVDYLVRIKAEDSEFTLQGIELQGDSVNTKYGIRTAKLADFTGTDSYKDPAWNEDSVVQRYVMHLEDCDINGITKGSDGRGMILYVGTRGSLFINNCTFSAINRDAINMYTDGDRTAANGPFQYVDSIVITNSTFNKIGREAINYRNSGETASDLTNKSRLSKIIIDHVTFNACGDNSATDSYYPMRVDAPQVLISNSLFTNMDQKSYIIGSNKNETSMVDYTEFWGVLKEGGAFDDVADAVDYQSASIGANVWLNVNDPMYADAAAGDFTLGETSAVLTLGSDGMALGDLRWVAEPEPQSREYASNEISALLTDLQGAIDGDEFILTTPGDQGFYTIDTTALEIHADVTIRSADGLMVKPMVKLVYDAALSMVDYMVRIKAEDSEFTLQGIELQGDSVNTKYGIRTAKLADFTGTDSYKDPAWNEDSVVQRYVMHLEDCDINGITKGSDGRGMILYVGTRGSLFINNCTFSAINRDAINMYTDGDRTAANGPFQYVDSIVITNSTFNKIGREAINYRNSGETASDLTNKSRLSKIIIDHVTFNACGDNSATDSYYPMRVDAPQVLISNSLFTNMDQKSYIIGSNKNETSMVDYTEFWGVLKEGGAFDDVADAVDYQSASIGANVWLNVNDPMFADAAAGDFTLGETSAVLTLGSDGMALGDLRWVAEPEPQSREYASNEISALLTDLQGAIDGDEFILTTPGDQGFYTIDTTALEIHADVTIRSADGLMVKPMVKLVYDAALSMVDYLVRIKAEDSEFTLQGIELQGDSVNTKYGIRTAKLADFTGTDSYKDPAWNEDSVVQRYVMHLEDCDINGITKGSDGRGMILYVGTRGSLFINNCTFSAINRDAINMYTDGDRTAANGPFQYVDSIVITNSTFNKIGREAINYRNSGETASDLTNKSRLSKIIIDHVTFNACGDNSATDSYYPMRVDAPQVLISNSLFTNMDQKSYIIGSNKNETSMVDYTEFWGVLKEGGAFDDVADAVDYQSASIGANVWLNVNDPMFADAAAGDFTLGATSTVLTLASDGLALGDLRWTPEPAVLSDDATLSDLTLDGTTVPGFAPSTTTYDVQLPAGTTAIPVIAGVATDPNATAVPTDATSLPGSSTVVVTAEDGTTEITYTVNFTVVVLSDDATLSDLTLDGTTVTGFAAGTVTYDVELPVGTTAVPAIAGVATDANATVVPTDAASLPGASTVEVTAEDGTTVITYTVNLTVAVGVENAVFSGLRIYPNPASESFKVVNCEGATIRIFSITGLEMFSKSYIANEESIQTSFDKGVYILQIDKDGSRISKKLVVK